ncbi:unnamed protein product [Closterium sp. NIES-54]
MLDGTDGSDEAGTLRSTNGADEAEGGLREPMGGFIVEGGDVRIEGAEQQQQGGGFMTDEPSLVQEEVYEAHSSFGQGSSLEEDRVVEIDEVQQGGGFTADAPGMVQEGASESGFSVSRVDFFEGEYAVEAEGGVEQGQSSEATQTSVEADEVPGWEHSFNAVSRTENDEEVREGGVSKETANKENDSPGSADSALPPNLLDSVDFLDPVAAFTKTLRMLHHFLSSQPTAESLPTFFLALPREHYFRADQDNSSSLCLPDDATCRNNGWCSGFSRPREWLEEGGEEQAHQQRWQRWRWRQERERRERRREWVQSSVGQMERVVEREMGRGDRVVLLQAGGLTDARFDAHVGSSLPAEMRVGRTERQDCSHFCVPGVPDTWNEMLVAALRLQEIMV